MPYCNNCNAHVSSTFYRVFSNEYGELWGCLECGTRQAGERRASKDRDNRGVG